MPCLVSPRHSHLPPPVGWPVMSEMLVAEGMLSERTIARRKKRVLDKFEPHATADIKRAFRSEGARVLDIVQAFRLPYVPKETAMSGIVAEGWVTINGAHVLIGDEDSTSGGSKSGSKSEEIKGYHTTGVAGGQGFGIGLPGQRGPGTYIALDAPYQPGAGEVLTAHVSISPTEVLDPGGIMTGTNAARSLTDNNDAMDKINAMPHREFKKLGGTWPGSAHHVRQHLLKQKGYKAEVGWIDGPHSNRELVVWDRSNVRFEKSKARKESGVVAEAAAPRVNNPDLARLLEFILNGQSASPYEAAFDTLYREVMPAAMDTATAEAMAAAGVGITGPLGRFPGAEKWIRDNAIRFGKKYASGVTETTNAAIRNQLALGWHDFEPMDKLMARVQKVYSTATDSRAEVIARTEGNRAYNEASHEAYGQLGADGHFSIISGSEYAVWPEICAVNASLGVIPMSQDFTDIDGNPVRCAPYHPNCPCDEGIDFSDSWQLPEWVTAEGI